MKVEFKGICTAVETKEVKPNEFAQKILIKRPERKDEFGQVVQKESFYEVQSYVKEANKNESKLFLPEDLIGKKVEVACYLNSSTYEKEPGKVMFILNLNLKSLTIIP